MREVYIKAAFVLVLEGELQKYKYSELDVVEAGWRIFLSQYITRLWTYQEAGLASKLIMQFADVAVDIMAIGKTAYQLNYDGPLRNSLYSITSMWVILRG